MSSSLWYASFFFNRFWFRLSVDTTFICGISRRAQTLIQVAEARSSGHVELGDIGPALRPPKKPQIILMSLYD